MSDVAPPRAPLSAMARRVLGVLVEKAKTTPDGYPMSASALISGCNQKSNRDPLMQADESDVLKALDELRSREAAREIQGSGRVSKYRHVAYEFLGVDSPGAAIMAELLLRGPQTLGELRARASRMHPFEDLASVQNVVDDLITRGLAQSVTPPGRGQQYAHRLYQPQEQLHLVAKVEKQAAASASPPASPSTFEASDAKLDKLLARLDDVTARLASLEAKFEELESC